MYAVIFRAIINDIDQEYVDASGSLRVLAESKYGCIKYISIREGYQEITISYWQTEEQIQAWKQDPEHLLAQQAGRNKWYTSYEVQITKLLRDYSSQNS